MKQNQRLFDHLAQMVAIPSVSLRSNEAIAAYVANYFAHIGFEITHFKAHPDAGQSNVIARIGPKGAPGLVLSGHMDVVPTKDQPWHFDPFKLTSYDNKLYGRGAVDMKGFIASAMVALRNIKPQDYQKELILIWTYDEETGCLGSKLLSDNVASLQGPLPEKCLIGEPTDCKMICKHNGIVTFKIDLKGKAAHSSQPSWGINTIFDSGKIINELESFAEEQKNYPDPLLAENHDDAGTTINVASIEGGIADNVIPDRCAIHVSIRPIPGTDPEHLLNEIKTRINRLNIESSWEMTVNNMVPGMDTGENTEFQQQLTPYARSKQASAAAYTTDGAHLQLMGMKPLIFGPGSIQQAHIPDEFIEAQKLYEFAPILEKIVKDQCCRP